MVSIKQNAISRQKDSEGRSELISSNGLSRKRKCLILIVTFIEVVLIGNIAGGWNVLVYVLKKDGVYGHVCEEMPPIRDPGNWTQSVGELSHSLGEQLFHLLSEYGVKYPSEDYAVYSSVNGTFGTHDCDEQDSHFSLAYTIAAAVGSFMCFPAGLMFDRYGTRVVRLITSLLNICMLFCLAFANGSLSWLIYPAACCMLLAGTPNMICAYNMCNLLGNKASTGIALLAGGATASALVMLLVKLAADAGYETIYSLTVLFVIQIIYIVNTIFIMPRFKIKEYTDLPSTELTNKTEHVFVLKGEKEENVMEKSPHQGDNILSLKNCITHPLLFIHILWFSISYMRLNYYVGTFNAWLNSVVDGDKERVSILSNIYGYILLGAVVISPLVGVLNDYMRKYIRKLKLENTERTIVSIPAILLAMMFTLLLSIITLIQEEWAVVASIILFMMTNALVYPSNSIYIQLGFPNTHFGKLFGLGYMVSGLFNLLQYGLFAWASATDDFLTPALVILGLVILSTGHAFNIYIHHRRAMAKKANIKSDDAIHEESQGTSPHTLCEHEITYF